MLCINCRVNACWDSEDHARWGNCMNEVHLCHRCFSQYSSPPEQVSNPLAQARGEPCDSQVKQSGPRAAAEVENPNVVRSPLHVQAKALYAPPEVAEIFLARHSDAPHIPAPDAFSNVPRCPILCMSCHIYTPVGNPWAMLVGEMVLMNSIYASDASRNTSDYGCHHPVP